MHGTAAYHGTYHQRVVEKDKAAVDYVGRYVAAWRREGDKHRRLIRLLIQLAP